MEILVNNVFESLKWRESKQLAGSIFARCVVLKPSLALLTGFAVQSQLPVLLCQSASMEEGSSWDMTVLGTSSGRYGNVWVGEALETTDVSWHHLHVERVAPLYYFEHVAMSINSSKPYAFPQFYLVFNNSYNGSSWKIYNFYNLWFWTLIVRKIF